MIPPSHGETGEVVRHHLFRAMLMGLLILLAVAVLTGAIVFAVASLIAVLR